MSTAFETKKEPLVGIGDSLKVRAPGSLKKKSLTSSVRPVERRGPSVRAGRVMGIHLGAGKDVIV